MNKIVSVILLFILGATTTSYALDSAGLSLPFRLEDFHYSKTPPQAAPLTPIALWDESDLPLEKSRRWNLAPRVHHVADVAKEPITEKLVLKFQRVLAQENYKEIRNIFTDVGEQAVATLVNRRPDGSYPPLAFLSTLNSANSTSWAKFLIENGALVNSYFGEIYSPLFTAVRYNNLPMVKFLLENKAKIPKGLLDCAATLPDQEIAKTLIQWRRIRPSLFAAANLNDERLVIAILQNGKYSVEDMAKTMEFAIKNRDVRLTKKLHEKGPQNIFSAALLNDEEYLRRLMPPNDPDFIPPPDLNTKLYFRDKKTRSPIELALSLGNTNAIKELIKLRANTQEIMQSAVENVDFYTLQQLGKAFANFQYVYPKGRSIVMIAISTLEAILREDRPDQDEKISTMRRIISVLVKGGANLAKFDHNGQTAVDYAKRLPKPQLAAEIIEIFAKDHEDSVP